MNSIAINKKIDNYQIKELQAYCLEILLAVNDFCIKNNITYFLGEGTLLGAIRHNGFIPWDDDIDILMPREDYEKFIKLAQTSLMKDYYLDCMETNPNYWVIGAKVKLTRQTEYVQYKVKNKKLSKYFGPYIDIFPLDYVPKKSGIRLRIQGYKIKALRRMLFFKTGYSMNFKNKFNIILFLYSKFISVNHIHKKIKSVMTKYNKNSSNQYMVNFASYYTVTRQTVHKSVYYPQRKHKFEGYDLPVPSNAEYLLKAIYGDYLTLPEESKRTSKHKYTKTQNQNI